MPPQPQKLGRRALLGALLGGLMAAAGGLWYEGKSSPKERVQALSQRLVSLSPGVTDTILALGRSAQLVGVSDYCSLPSDAQISKLGSAITPHFEDIAIAQPTLILTSQVAGDQLVPLQEIATTIALPWLTLDEWTQSVAKLGVLIHAEDAAKNLRARIEDELKIAAPPGAPRILLALDYGESGESETWFIRKNSIHGDLLRAAGAKNAVEKDISGQPKLSPEQLLLLDPDAIIVLRSGLPNADAEERSLSHYRKWTPLTAVKEKRIRALSVPDALTIGPKVLALVPKLRALIQELFPKLPSPAASTATPSPQRE